MYFIQLNTEDKTVTFHFDTVTELENLECFKDDSDRKFGDAWLPDELNDYAFAHQDDADACAEFYFLDVGEEYEKKYCPKCFRKLAGKAVESKLKINVVVFAQGCVDPEIFATFDDEIARVLYLMHDHGSTDEDLISWQRVPISVLEE